MSTFQATVSGGVLTATRPKHFFRDDSDMPETVTVPIARPRAFAEIEQKKWTALVTEHVRAKEAEHRQRRKATGRTVLGAKAVCDQEPSGSPSSHAPHFRLSPRVAAKSKWARVEALLRNHVFGESYRAAFKDHIAGLANVVFPFGTYWMRKFGKVACEAAEAVEATVCGRSSDPVPA